MMTEQERADQIRIDAARKSNPAWDRMLIAQMCETMMATLRGWDYDYVPRATIMEWVSAQGQ